MGRPRNRSCDRRCRTRFWSRLRTPTCNDRVPNGRLTSRPNDGRTGHQRAVIALVKVPDVQRSWSLGRSVRWSRSATPHPAHRLTSAGRSEHTAHWQCLLCNGSPNRVSRLLWSGTPDPGFCAGVTRHACDRRQGRESRMTKYRNYWVYSVGCLVVRAVGCCGGQGGQQKDTGHSSCLRRMVHRVGLDHDRQVRLPTAQTLAPAKYSYFLRRRGNAGVIAGS